jgi:hypothetical protein
LGFNYNIPTFITSPKGLLNLVTCLTLENPKHSVTYTAYRAGLKPIEPIWSRTEGTGWSYLLLTVQAYTTHCRFYREQHWTQHLLRPALSACLCLCCIYMYGHSALINASLGFFLLQRIIHIMEEIFLRKKWRYQETVNRRTDNIMAKDERSNNGRQDNR